MRKKLMKARVLETEKLVLSEHATKMIHGRLSGVVTKIVRMMNRSSSKRSMFNT